MRKPKFLIIGSARHGKDTMAEILSEKYGLTFQSSSVRAAEIFLFSALKDKYGYKTFQECFEDRVNHRAEWKSLISDYNSIDRARLAKDILATSDIYVGMRDSDEIAECKNQHLFDLIIYVDASERLPMEGNDSNGISKDDADIIIENNGSLPEFVDKVYRLFDLFHLQ